MKAIIVEDHPDIRAELLEIIRKHCGAVDIVGTASSVVTAAKVIQETNPDLVFLDIELPDGTGFDLLDIVDKQLKVIFITGSDSYAVRAFRYAALDYLLKPVDPEDLADAVRRAETELTVDKAQLDIYKSSYRREETPERIALHTSDKIHFVDVVNILRCMADGNYTKFYLKGGATLLVAKTLKDYDALLSGVDFLRVHQSHLVNMKQVREYVKADGGYLVMQDGTKIPVSTRKKAEVLDEFDKMRK